MKLRIPLIALALASVVLPVAAQQDNTPRSHSLGTSTQGGFPPPERVDFGPPPPAAEVDPDAKLLMSVTEALTSDETLSGADLTVLVSGGNVTISGTALTEAQAAYAKGVAVGVAGAENVEGVVAVQ